MPRRLSRQACALLTSPIGVAAPATLEYLKRADDMPACEGAKRRAAAGSFDHPSHDSYFATHVFFRDPCLSRPMSFATDVDCVSEIKQC
jgi:hypothetical protein